jgi:hypothetical protein
METTSLLIGLVIIVSVIFLMRLLGAWMLRINEIIKLQEKTLEELKKLNINKDR